MNRTQARRALLGGAALWGIGALTGCDACAGSGPGPDPSPPGRGATDHDADADLGWAEWSIAPSDAWPEPQHVTTLTVRDGPVVVALHGAGEAGRGLVTGSRGWRDDYDLGRAHRRLLAPPLSSEDFHGFVNEERLHTLNAALRAAPYRGVTVACPYTPRLLDRSLAGARGYARFITEALLPRVRLELGGDAALGDSGIDGVSMGGRLALLVGLSNPTIFAAVGALQPAIDVAEAGWLSELASRAASVRKVALRLVSSDGDPFLSAVLALAKRLDVDRVAHELVVTPGPHDYVWNRGPGSYELLFFHDRALRST